MTKCGSCNTRQTVPDVPFAVKVCVSTVWLPRITGNCTKHEIGVAFNGMTFKPNVVKIEKMIRKLKGANHIHGQHSGLRSLLPHPFKVIHYVEKEAVDGENGLNWIW